MLLEKFQKHNIIRPQDLLFTNYNKRNRWEQITENYDIT